MEIGTTIKQIRQRKGVRQKFLAKDAGITQSYLSLIENGEKEPTISVLTSIAKALGMTVAVMFAYSLSSEDMPPDKVLAHDIIKPILSGLIEQYFFS